MSDKNEQAMMPEVTFSTFVLSLASSALVHLGEVPNPETGGTTRNEVLARNAIDVLTMLDDKTRVTAFKKFLKSIRKAFVDFLKALVEFERKCIFHSLR